MLRYLFFVALSVLLFPFCASANTAGSIHMEGSRCVIDGITYPAVGFGTCLIHDATCKTAIDWAAQDGYRIIDTATIYRNFSPIGEGIKKYGRQNFYLISKVWHNQLTPNHIRHDLAKTLQQLKTPYLDAYLIHWPNSSVPIEETLWTMEELRRSGKIRHIGLSNVTANHVRRALQVGVPITWVQVEMHPFFCDFALLDLCHSQGIAVQAWCPLDRGRRVGKDGLLSDIGKRYNKTPEQVALKWIAQHGCIPLPCSRNREHIRQNLEIDDFALSADEIAQIDQRARYGQRRGASVSELGFTDEFGFTYEQCWPTAHK